MKKIFTFITFSFLAISVFSQSENEVPSYYNKKKGRTEVSDYKNIISTDLPSIIDGEIPFIWDHNISNLFQTSLGFGILAPYYSKTEFSYPITSTLQPFSNSNWGYSAYGAATILFDFFWLSYISLYGHYKGFSTVNVFDSGFRVGYKFCLGTSKITMDLGGYAGFLFQKTKDGYTQYVYTDEFSNDYPFEMVIGVTLRIGYIIN